MSDALIDQNYQGSGYIKSYTCGSLITLGKFIILTWLFAHLVSVIKQQPSPASLEMSDKLLKYRKDLKQFYAKRSLEALDSKYFVYSGNEFFNLALIEKKPESSKVDTSHGVDEIIASKIPLDFDDLVTSDV